MAKERRTKRRLDTSNPADEPQEEHEEAPEVPRQVILMGNRQVTSRRCVDFTFLEQENLRVGDWLIAQGWKLFCMLNLPTFQI